MNSFARLTALTAAQIDKIQEATASLLATTGVVVEHDSLLRKAAAAGARVDEAGGRVRFPVPLQRELLGRVPRHYAIRGMLGDTWEIGGDTQHGFAIVTDPWIIDYQTQQPRHPSLEDIRRHTILAQRLDPLATISRMDYPVTDVADATSSLRALEIHLLNHTRHYTVLPATRESLDQWLEILPIVARGTEVRDLASIGIAVVSPLTLNQLNADLLVRSAERGFAVLPTICPMAGSTAPYTLAGTLLQANAEALAVALLAQTVQPGTPFLYTIGVSVTDLQTGHDRYYTLDKVLWKLGIAQLGLAYGLPTGAECGGTMTHRYDQQNGAEGMLFMLAAHTSGAHVLAGFGSCYNANGMSAEMMVIHEAWLQAARFLARGINTDDRHLARADIAAAGPGGNFLTDDLTLELLRGDEFFQHDLFDLSGGYGPGRSLLERAHDQVEHLVEGFQSPVPGEVQEGLRRHFHDLYGTTS